MRSQPSPRAHIIAGVPFFPQQPHQCGPAALAALLGFFGHPIDPERIAEEIYEPTSAGTSTVAMLAYGARHRLPLHTMPGDIEDIHREIDAGRPLIALHRRAWLWRDFHYVVVTGYEPGDGTLYGYSGRSAHARWSAEEFRRRWAPGGNWLLLWTGGERGQARAADRGDRADDHPETREGK
jgi:ABC-type bacteriocin/lantibiotic exporter with double-glycine peptidase domain